MSASSNRPLLIALAGATLLVVGGGLYGCSRSQNSDHLSDQQAGVAPGAQENLAAGVDAEPTRQDPAVRCASAKTYDLLKRELFRRAAELGRRDGATFDKIANAVALRVEQPVVRSRDEGLGSIACAARAAVDLPPGLAVAGGRTTLVADLDYSLQPAADGTGDVLTLLNADQITVPLATLSRSVVPAALEASSRPTDPLAPAAAPPATQAPVPAPPVVRSPAPASAPSFSCERPRSRGEAAVCADPGLAALDRQMAAQYRSAQGAADPDQRSQLILTGRRFIGFRDNCPDVRCIVNAYRGRMREIDAIMTGGGRDDRF